MSMSNSSSVMKDKSEKTNLDSTATSSMKYSEENVKEIPLKISVELGHFTVDVGSGSPLPAGKILPIHSDCPGLVKIMHQGREIGRGELLSIDEKMAIRVVKNWSN